MDPCLLLTSPGEGYYEEKKSRFLALATAVRSEDEAQAVLHAQKKTYSDARHHCHAFVCGLRNEVSRFSDDGEPSGTGGRPILEALLGSGLHNTLVVVTRYFGGTLLGTGGLSRAYAAAAAEALDKAGSAYLYEGALWEAVVRYGDYAKLDRLLLQNDIPRVSEAFSEQVSLQFCLLQEEEPRVLTALADLSAGTALITKMKDTRFLRNGNEIILDYV